MPDMVTCYTVCFAEGADGRIEFGRDVLISLPQARDWARDLINNYLIDAGSLLDDAYRVATEETRELAIGDVACVAQPDFGQLVVTVMISELRLPRHILERA